MQNAQESAALTAAPKKVEKTLMSSFYTAIPTPTADHPVNDDLVITSTVDENAVVEEESGLLTEPVVPKIVTNIAVPQAQEDTKATISPATKFSCASSAFDAYQLSLIAMDFRQHISPKSMMAFGCKQPQVFTGIEAAKCLSESVDSLFGDIKQKGPLLTHDDLMRLADVLIFEMMLFVPCGVQQRTYVLHEGKDEESFYEFDAKTDDGIVRRKATFAFMDNEKTLYRLTGHSILLGDHSEKVFDAFLMTVVDPEDGVELVHGEKVMFRRISKSMRYFTKASLASWLDAHYGLCAPEDAKLVIKLLSRHKVIRKVSFTRYYKFTAK